MVNMLWRIRKIYCVALLLVGFGSCYAGGIVPQRSTLTFENGHSVVLPGAHIRLRFKVAQYMYGSREYSYVALAAMKASETSPNATKAKDWPVFLGVLSGKPENTDFPDDDTAYIIDFDAPLQPGRYKVVMGGVPMFTKSPLSHKVDTRRSFEPVAKDKAALLKTLLEYPRAIELVAHFTVSSSARKPEETPTVYLRLNGKVPHLAKNLEGMQKNPLVFSWTPGKEFKVAGGKFQFRYRMQPTDDAFGVWSDATHASYSFLAKGSHQFQVQARYTGGTSALESQPASYEFYLNKEHLSEPLTKGTPEANAAPITIGFNDVYGKSRALLVGMWNFSDARRFPRFDAGKISADLVAMDKALRKNGFEVTTLKKEKLSRDEIVEALAAIVASASPNDRIFIYFSTHGFADPGKPSDGYLATYNCSYERPEVHCLNLRDLEHYSTKALNEKNAKQVLFAVDSCFSGLGVVLKSAADDHNVNYSQLAVPKGAFMLTAGMANQPRRLIRYWV